MLKRILTALLLIVLVSHANAFFDKVSDHANTVSSTLGTTSSIISSLENIGISNAQDQQVWNNFLNDCVKGHVSIDKLTSLASEGVGGISDFLSTFKAPSDIMTTVYNKAVSCPHAVPVAKKIINSISAYK